MRVCKRELSRWGCGLGLALALCWSPQAGAAPEEIQVYLDEFNEPGEWGLDVHTNYVSVAQPGSPSRHQFRATPEWSYGLDEHFEAGLYLLNSTSPEISAGHPVTDGAKIRMKWRPYVPSPDSPWYFAMNWEIGDLANRDDPDVHSTQLKFIETYHQGPWLAGVNFNLNGWLKPHPTQASNAELDYRLTYQLTPHDRGDWRVGLERYDIMGALHPNSDSLSPHTTSDYLVSDFAVGHWDFDLGVGRAWGNPVANTDKWVFKMIVGVPI